MRLGCPGAICLVCLANIGQLVFGQFPADYATNYYDDYSLFSAGYHYDEADDGFMYNPYTGAYDDIYDDYYFDDVHETLSDCRIDESGKPKFNGGWLSYG